MSGDFSKPNPLLSRSVYFGLFFLFLSVGPIVFPNFFWNGILIADAIHPFMYHNKWVNGYHSFLMSMLPDRDEEPAFELPLANLTKDSLYAASNGYTRPVVIRRAVVNVPAVKQWSNKTWWMENYGEENVMVII